MNGVSAMERSGATSIVTSSMVIVIEAITATETLIWMTQKHLTRAIIAVDSMSSLQKVERKMLYADWCELIREDGIEMRYWIV